MEAVLTGNKKRDMIIHQSKSKFKIYPQASRVLNKPSAASFLKLIPRDNPTCPGMTWVSLASQCHVRHSSCLLFSLLQPKVLQGQELHTGLSPSDDLPFVPPLRFLLCHWSWLLLQGHRQPQGQSGKHHSHLPVQSSSTGQRLKSSSK